MKTLLLALVLCLVSCSAPSTNNKLIVSIKEQRASIVNETTNRVVKKMPISSGYGGVGDKPGSHATPIGLFKVIKKIGENLPLTTGFKGGCPTKHPTGKDPILGRVIQIDGMEKQNKLARSRGILIHGTPYTSKLGIPVSLGCLRFSVEDVALVFNSVSVGDVIEVR